ncbi:MAG: tetraacyldisaccharide 4'-kinase [Desulfohalobiaceae bacterium]|nr:tetraacyldisaccharide 4'-kinase [Desulfohalobiaceae bacterium]
MVASSQQRWIEWGRRFLGPAGRIYGAGMRIRETLYATRILGSWRPPVPCVSIGNISWGGSGKTPLAEWILQFALGKGMTPALLSRGYKAIPPYYPFLVRARDRAAETGDEPLMLARSCRNALVVIDPRRDRGGQWIWDRNRPDLFVLDDGMQHLRVERDLDLVLLTPRDLKQDWNRVLPSGPWREGKRALRRAGAFVVHTSPGTEAGVFARLRSRVLLGDRPVFSVYLEPKGLKRPDGSSVELSPGEPYLLISGVGRPEGVEQSATSLLGDPPERHLAFPDHHPFSGEDWEWIRRTADDFGCRVIVCTPKDAVKLEGLADTRLASLDLRLSFGETDNTRLDFPAWLEQALNEASRKG